MATLTIMPTGGRGCGKRKEGGLYASMGLGEDGIHMSNFMLDPPVPFLNGAPFQGMHEAPEYITSGWDTEQHLVLMDWVGESGYATVPDFIEEIRRFGMSRRIPSTFDFESVNFRQVWLALVHAKAAPDVESIDYLAPWEYEWCRYHPATTDNPKHHEHFRECLYHDWLLAFKEHGVNPIEKRAIEAPWGTYNPLWMVTRSTVPSNLKPRDLVMAMDEPTYPFPAFFAVMPITHFEAVQYVEEDVAEKVEKGGSELYVVEE